MHVTLLRMLSTNSLQAFSGVNATGPLHRTGAAGQVRLVRDQAGAVASAASKQAQPAPKLDLPATVPDRNLPRGSLLNLAV